MKYYSTRDAAVRMDAAEAIKMGLSRDGGLLTPCEIPQIDRAFLESLVNVRYQERAAKVMGLYLTDYTYEELSGFAENAYGPEQREWVMPSKASWMGWAKSYMGKMHHLVPWRWCSM